MLSTLSAELSCLLCCPSCRSSLEEQSHGYRCSACKKEFPIVHGVLRFVDPSNYADSFGYQWQKFSKTQLKPAFAEWDFQQKSGMRKEEFRGKLVLDVGCGMGRFAEVATRWGGRVIGIDLSAAAEVAASNLADREFVAVQADVFSLPFLPETFDCIYGIGVLHHTPNCERAFKALPAYLKPDGSLAVWLYSAYNNWYRFSDQYRKITRNLSTERLHSFLEIAVPILYRIDCGLRAIPLIGGPLAGVAHHLFPVNLSSNPELRVLDTLDWYSPRYQSKHTYEEVFRWFESFGFVDLTVGHVSIGVKGRKPNRRLEQNARETNWFAKQTSNRDDEDVGRRIETSRSNTDVVKR